MKTRLPIDTEPSLEYALDCQWQSKLEVMGFQDLGGVLQYDWQGWCIRAKWYEFTGSSCSVSFTVENRFVALGDIRGFVYISNSRAVHLGALLVELLHSNPERNTAQRVAALKFIADGNNDKDIWELARY